MITVRRLSRLLILPFFRLKANLLSSRSFTLRRLSRMPLSTRPSNSHTLRSSQCVPSFLSLSPLPLSLSRFLTHPLPFFLLLLSSSIVCHLCLTTSLATTAIRTFVPPPPPPLWKPFPPSTVNPSLLRSLPPKRYAPSDLNIEGICPVCREVLPGGLTGKGRRTGTRGGRGGFGLGGKWKEGEGKGEGVRRLEMRVVDC